MKGEPILGRVFRPEEQEDGKDFAIVLSFALWQRRFGGDPQIVGKTISLNSRPYTIVGVKCGTLPATPPRPESILPPGS